MGQLVLAVLQLVLAWMGAASCRLGQACLNMVTPFKSPPTSLQRLL